MNIEAVNQRLTMPDRGTWGHRIKLEGTPPIQAGVRGRAYGWISNPKVEEGETFAYRLSSQESDRENYVCYRLENVEYQADPTNMFFADVVCLGQLDPKYSSNLG